MTEKLFPVLQKCFVKFMRKGMMKDGVRPVRSTLFIVKRYGVIYRLQA